MEVRTSPRYFRSWVETARLARTLGRRRRPDPSAALSILGPRRDPEVRQAIVRLSSSPHDYEGSMTTRLAPTERGEHSEQPIAGDVSVPLRLLDRDDLLQRLDRAVSSKQLTVISAPPGSGKTSLLRAWADRSRKKRRVA